jgi:hydroxymethylbilane synthase
MVLKIGTRASKLAVTQSEWVRGRILAQHPNIRVELVRIKTKGDRIVDSPLSRIGGKGLFVKEIEDALLTGKVDLAVHSMKDVPGELPEGLSVAVFPEREESGDAFVSSRYKKMEELPKGASVGTGSLRRSAQLLSLRPDLKIIPIRGNVDTRLKKLDSGGFDAIILAAAGLNRLGLGSRIRSVLTPEEIIPAVGQGALGLEIREDDDHLLEIIDFLNHKPTYLTVKAERAFLKRLEGGCQVPIAGHGQLDNEKIRLKGMVAELDGSRIIKDEVNGDMEKPDDIGIHLAERLIASGGNEILNRIYGKG